MHVVHHIGAYDKFVRKELIVKTTLEKSGRFVVEVYEREISDYGAGRLLRRVVDVQIDLDPENYKGVQ